jgi:hypothetical protein
MEYGEQAHRCEAIVVEMKLRKSGGCAVKDCVLTWGDLALRLKGRRPRGWQREVSRCRSNRRNPVKG